MLVSCIMPTYSGKGSRRHLIPLAVRSYLHQDWPEKEMIVVADGEDVSDLFTSVPNVIYLPRSEKESLGRKRNLACEFSSGEIIVHWDDDDWSSPTRITDQVERMFSNFVSVSGYHSILFWDWTINRACKYFGSKNYSCDTALCYSKEYWKGNKFNENLGKDEDARFAHKAASQKQLISVDGEDRVVALTHGSNTSHDGQRPFPVVDTSAVPQKFFEDLFWIAQLPKSHT